MTPDSSTFRCAIYTRKSSEEGLDQSFNSLHAQREACEAYIKSQAHEGWTCLPDCYDDGGFSGGTMNRPALVALKAAIERGLIDIVVVYKVDRLTRSLMDFSKIVDAFVQRKVSLVSVTQAFNTTTSMGRLTLNVLLSFCSVRARGDRGAHPRQDHRIQEEGDVDGRQPAARIRSERTTRLVINEAEAEQVRDIFQRYLAIGSVDNLQNELTAAGVRSKCRVTRAGATIGGNAFSRGATLSSAHQPSLLRLDPP